MLQFLDASLSLQSPITEQPEEYGQRKSRRLQRCRKTKGARALAIPRTTLEEALKIAYAIKEHNGGNPWELEETKAIGAGTGGNATFISPLIKRLRLNPGYKCG